MCHQPPFRHFPAGFIFSLMLLCLSLTNHSNAAAILDSNGHPHSFFNQPFSGSSWMAFQPLAKKKQHPFRMASTQLMLAEIIPLAFNKYAHQASYAQVSLDNIRYNLQWSSWTWDDDEFEINQFEHPYHGSLFFNAFRSNGYGFWKSVPASFAGSYLWETFAENQAPSLNDFINTGFGGVMVGEMTHRLVEKMHRSNSKGFKKQVTEIAAMLINPMDGYRRILDRKWGKPGPSLFEPNPPELNAEFDLGIRKYNVNAKSPFAQGHFGPFGRIKLIYGNPAKDIKTPFSNIYITTEFGEDDSSALNVLSVHGSLTGWKLYSSQKTIPVILSANYDYIKNEAFFYGAESIRLNIYPEFQLNKNMLLNGSAGLGTIILSAVPDGYGFLGRNYNYGPGITVNTSCRINYLKTLIYRFNFLGCWTKTINGNQSDFFLQTITNELNIKFRKDLSLSAEYGHFILRGNYDQLDDITKTYPYLRISIKYLYAF